MKRPPKSYWNARVIVTTDAKDPKIKFWAIHEVYYKKGAPFAMSLNPVTITSDVSLKDLKLYLKILKRAFKSPCLSGDKKTLYQEVCSGKTQTKKKHENS